MSILINLGVITFTSIIIYFLGEWFADASSNIGEYLRLPKSVKGATFDAIAGSFPELMVALFSVILFKKFELGIGTIAGSALFNLLIIPGLCVLVATKKFKVSSEIISRDGLFYNFAVFALLFALIYTKNWGYSIPLIFLIIYGFYLRDIIKDSKEERKNNKKKDLGINIYKESSIAFIAMVLMGVATYFLTESSIEFAYTMGISPLIVGFTIAAAATSIPDTVISVANAKKGNIDDAVANVFGSNIFDILVGLSIPLLLAIFLTGPVEIIFNNIEIILGLLGATILVLYMLAKNHTLSKKQGIFLLLMYILFVIYIVVLSI